MTGLACGEMSIVRTRRDHRSNRNEPIDARFSIILSFVRWTRYTRPRKVTRALMACRYTIHFSSAIQASRLSIRRRDLSRVCQLQSLRRHWQRGMFAGRIGVTYRDYVRCSYGVRSGLPGMRSLTARLMLEESFRAEEAAVERL